LIRQSALEEPQKILGIGQRRSGIHGGAVAAEVALVQFGFDAAEAGTDDHAELAGAVQTDAHLDCAGRRGGIEGQAKAVEQRLQFARVERAAPLPRRLAKQLGGARYRWIAHVTVLPDESRRGMRR
jgi:hypothetical protein